MGANFSIPGGSDSITRDDQSLLVSDKELLWKSLPKEQAKDEMENIMDSLDKCPSEKVNFAINCGDVTKEKYEADIITKTQETCADSTQCKEYCDKAIETKVAELEQDIQDNIDSNMDDPVTAPVASNYTLKVISKDDDTKTLKELDDVDIKGETLKKDSTMVLTFKTDTTLKSAKFIWKSDPSSDVEANCTLSSNNLTCKAKLNKDIPNFDKADHVLFDVEWKINDASTGTFKHTDMGFGDSDLVTETPADPVQEDPVQEDPVQEDPVQEDPVQEEVQDGFDNIISFLNPCDKHRETYLFLLLLIILALIMLNKDEVMKYVKKFKKMIC